MTDSLCDYLSKNYCEWIDKIKRLIEYKPLSGLTAHQLDRPFRGIIQSRLVR